MLEADFIRLLVGDRFPSEHDFAVFSRHVGYICRLAEVKDGGQEHKQQKDGSRLLASSVYLPSDA